MNVSTFPSSQKPALNCKLTTILGFLCGHTIAARYKRPVEHLFSCWYCSEPHTDLAGFEALCDDATSYSKVMAEKVVPYGIDQHNTATIRLYNTFALHRELSKGPPLPPHMRIAPTEADRIIKTMVKRSTEVQEAERASRKIREDEITKEKARAKELAAAEKALADKKHFEKVANQVAEIKASAEKDAEWEKVGDAKDVMDADWVVLVGEEDW